MTANAIRRRAISMVPNRSSPKKTWKWLSERCRTAPRSASFNS